MPDKPKPITPLRQRMIDDMTARRFSEATRKDYVRHVRNFAAFLGRSPDTATSDDLRRFQLHMAQQQVSPWSINAAIAALRFFFTVTLEKPDVVRPLRIVNEPRKAPVVLSQEEVAHLLQAAPGLKYKAALSVAYGAGLRVSEVANLKVSDIDSERMTLRVEQGKGQRDRTVMLSPAIARALARMVVGGAAAGLAVSGPEPDQSDHSPSAQSRRHRRQRSGRHLQARVTTYPET
jgi:integrase/recombinase XerD